MNADNLRWIYLIMFSPSFKNVALLTDNICEMDAKLRAHLVQLFVVLFTRQILYANCEVCHVHVLFVDVILLLFDRSAKPGRIKDEE